MFRNGYETHSGRKAGEGIVKQWNEGMGNHCIMECGGMERKKSACAIKEKIYIS